MKKISRILTLFLTAGIIFSAFTAFSYAADSTVYVNAAEGVDSTDVYSGCGVLFTQRDSAALSYATVTQLDGNKYIAVNRETDKSGAGIITENPDQQLFIGDKDMNTSTKSVLPSGDYVLEFDISSSTEYISEFSLVAYARPNVAPVLLTFSRVSEGANAGKLAIYKGETKDNDSLVGYAAVSEWTHIRVEFSTIAVSNVCSGHLYINGTDAGAFSVDCGLMWTYNKNQFKTMRLSITKDAFNSSAANASICLDNIKLVNGVSDPTYIVPEKIGLKTAELENVFKNAYQSYASKETSAAKKDLLYVKLLRLTETGLLADNQNIKTEYNAILNEHTARTLADYKTRVGAETDNSAKLGLCDEVTAILDTLATDWVDISGNTAVAYRTYFGTERAKAVSALSEISVAEANTLLGNVNSATTTMNMKIAMDTLNAYIKANVFDEKSAGCIAFKADKAKADTKLAEKIQLLKDALESQVSLAEYDWIGLYNKYEFESGKGLGCANSGKNESKNIFDLKHPGCNSDTSFTLNYVDNFSDYYASVGFTSSTYPITIEMDITSFTNYPDTFSFGNGEYEIVNGYTTDERVFPSFASIKGNSLYASVKTVTNGTVKFTSTQIAKNCFTVGEWSHLAITFDPTTKTVDIYLDYNFLGTYSCNINKDFNISGCRFGNGGDKGVSSISFDNITYYEGSSPRTYDRFLKMTNTEKLQYYVPYFTDESNDPLSREKAYSLTGSIVMSFIDEDGNYKTDDKNIINLIETYNDFNTTALIAKVCELNMNTLKSHYANLSSINRVLSTTAERGLQLNVIDAFVSSAKFDTSTADYKFLMNEISAAKVLYNYDVSANDFIRTLDIFDRSTILTAKQKHLDELTAIYTAGLDYGNTPELKEAYKRYAEAQDIVANLIKDKNSSNFIEYISYISMYSPEQYEENYNYINKFILLARQTIYDDNYSAEYKGFAAAKAIFDKMDEYFYERLQQNHITYLNSLIDKFDKAQSYVEKLGSCESIRNYFADNDIDYSRNEIQSILRTTAIFESQLSDAKNSFEETIIQNSSYFINAVKQLDVCNDFVSMREMYLVAESYYHFMSLDYEGISEAVRIFTEYRDVIDTTSENAEKFLAAVEKIEAATSRKELYLALSDAYIAYTNTDDSYDGVTEAKTTYETALEKYNADVETVNSDVKQTTEVLSTANTLVAASKFGVAIFRKYYY